MAVAASEQVGQIRVFTVGRFHIPLPIQASSGMPFAGHGLPQNPIVLQRPLLLTCCCLLHPHNLVIASFPALNPWNGCQEKQVQKNKLRNSSMSTLLRNLEFLTTEVLSE